MKKIFSILMLLVIVISLVGCSGGESPFEDTSKYEKIAQNIECGEIDKAVNLCTEIEGEVSQKGKDIVMNALKVKLNSKITSTTTSFFQENQMIDNDVIAEYKQYKKIVDAMSLSTQDYTNIDTYIDTVISTEKYDKYGELWCLWKDMQGDMDDGNTYYDRAVNSYSDYMRESHAEKARNSFRSCLSMCNNYDINAFGIRETYNFLDNYVSELNDYLNGGECSVSTYLAEEWQSKQDEASEKWLELTNLLKKLPTTLYYGEEKGE